MPVLRGLVGIEKKGVDISDFDIVAFCKSLGRLLVTECFIALHVSIQPSKEDVPELESEDSRHPSGLTLISSIFISKAGLVMEEYHIESINALRQDSKNISIIFFLKHSETAREANVTHDIER